MAFDCSAGRHSAASGLLFSITVCIAEGMAWLYLTLAGLLEIGWPVGLKVAQNPQTRWLGVLATTGFMALSGFFLWLAQRHIPMGTAYAVWTGIGASGTFLIGVIHYGDPASLIRFAGVALILLGVITLKLGH